MYTAEEMNKQLLENLDLKEVYQKIKESTDNNNSSYIHFNKLNSIEVAHLRVNGFVVDNYKDNPNYFIITW